MAFFFRVLGSSRMMLSLCLALAALAALLYGVLRFDLATSPAWQMVPYLLVLLMLSFLPLGLASNRLFSTMGRFQYLLFFLVLLAPVAALGVGWFQDGLYEGLRDRRLFLALVTSFSLSSLGCAFLVFVQIFAVLACIFAGFAKRPGIMALPWMTWFVPWETLARWSAEANGSRESEPDE